MLQQKKKFNMTEFLICSILEREREREKKESCLSIFVCVFLILIFWLL